LAAVGEPEPDFLTATAVFIALALEVVPERDLRVEEDHEATFVLGKSEDQRFPDVGV
jgi:hypothetical protein